MPTLGTLRPVELSDADCRELLEAAFDDDAARLRRALPRVIPALVANVRKVLNRRGTEPTEMEDIQQEVMIKLLTWKPREVTPHPRATLLAWTRDVAWTVGENRARRPRRHVELSDELVAPQRGAAEELADRRMAQTLVACAEHLKPNHARLYQLLRDAEGELGGRELAVHLELLTTAEVSESSPNEELSVRIKRATDLVYQWSRNMRDALADCLERTFGQDALPESGLRWGGKPKATR